MRTLTLLTVGTLAAHLCGCTVTNAPNCALLEVTETVHDSVMGWRSETDEPVRLRTQGPVSVTVEAFAGDVRIVTDESAAETEVVVRRLGTHGWERTEEAEASLSDIQYAVALERSEGNDTAVIHATTHNDEPHFQRVEITVIVPLLAGANVKTTHGDVWISENRGPVNVETTRGSIRVMTPWKMMQPMTLVTSDGLIDLRIRGESAGAFDAETVGGRVRAHVRFGKWTVLDNRNDADTLHAALNDGTNPVVLRTSNADVMISIVADPVSSNPFPAMW